MNSFLRMTNRPLGLSARLLGLMALLSTPALAEDRFTTSVESEGSRGSMVERAVNMDNMTIDMAGGRLPGQTSSANSSVGSNAQGVVNQARVKLNEYKAQMAATTATQNSKIASLQRQLSDVGGGEYTFSQTSEWKADCYANGTPGSRTYTYLKVYEDGRLKQKVQTAVTSCRSLY